MRYVIEHYLTPKIDIRESKIPKAGLGIFATVDMPNSVVIGVYAGEIKRIPSNLQKEFLSRPGVGYEDSSFLEREEAKKSHSPVLKQFYGSYMLGDVAAGFLHDSEKFGNITRFCNSADYLGDPRANVDRQTLTVDGVKYSVLFTSRMVRAGEELLTLY